MSNKEETLSIIKPDAVERNLSEEIKQEFKKKWIYNFKRKKNKTWKKWSWKILSSSSI